MESASHVSSEDELLQLREEGKISEAEYKDLLTALTKSQRGIEKLELSETLNTKTEQKSGKIALIIMLAGLFLPAMGFGIIQLSTGPNQGAAIAPWFYLGVVFEIVAFVLGISSWPDIQAKVTVITIGTIAAFIVLLISLSYFSRIKLERALLDIKMTEVQLAREDQAARSHSRHTESVELKSYPLDDMEGLITRSNISIDESISSDGNGSLRIEATESTKIRLFETGNIDIENAQLFYQAKIRTEKVQGEVYLEMWCHFPGNGEFFSKGNFDEKSLFGTTDWTTEEIPFLFREGENPDNIKLNLVINGKGTVWIDDIRLLKGSLL